ncbi:MAG: hypothetical protein QOJ65_1552 [Fimbriimonadaceae bacterium]|jgi:hypothetical protein|nr:hypothetical protein [Fimbriimonadaceae bacterium]
MRKGILGAAVALVLGASTGSAYGVVLGQIDTFEDGSTDGWVNSLLGRGGPNPPINVSTGGPGGTDDNYMLLTSSGSPGPGGKMVVINPAQWSGDYIGGGVTTLTMALNNFGDTELHLRILFEKVAPGSGPTDVAGSTDAFVIAPHSGWVNATFDVTPGALTSLLGSVDNALSDATVIRLYHNSAGPGFPPGDIAASLGVDNIRAVPEPGTLTAFLVGGAIMARRRLKRSRGAA